MDSQERRGLKAMMIGYSMLGIIMVIGMFFVLWAEHKEKQAMKGITHISVERVELAQHTENPFSTTQHNTHNCTYKNPALCFSGGVVIYK